MNKKGQGMQEHINELIIGVVVLLILVAVVIGWYSVFEKKAPELACRTSVIARENMKLDIPVLPDKNLFPVQCKTLDRTLPEESLSDMGVDERKDQTMKEIADLMAKCWWMFDNGKYNNIFSDSYKNSNLCHACYTFEIAPSSNIGSISKDEFYTYLQTHSFELGLLEGGVGALGAIGRHEFLPIIGESKTTAPGKLFNNNDLYRGVADYTSLFVGNEDRKDELYAEIGKISGGGALEPAVIIVNKLSEESVKEGSDLAYQFFSEWKVGDQQKKNGIIIIIALENGVALYATQSGADALFPTYVIEEVLASMDDSMERQDAITGILEMSRSFNTKIEELGGSTEVQRLLLWQNSYAAFIGGGVRGPLEERSGQNAAGAITSTKSFEHFVPGIRYAISYISPRQQDNCLGDIDWWCWGSKAPNMIAFSEHFELFGKEPICNIVG